MTAWTDERLGELKRLWAENWTASDIAAALGQGLTRNAVLGKVHRLKLDKRTGKHTPRVNEPTRIKPSMPAVTKAGRVEREEPPAIVPVEIVEPKGRGVSINALDGVFKMCRWIVSADPLRKGRDRYCGEPVAGNCSWCGWHKAKAFTKATGPNPQPDLKKKVQHKPSMADRSFGAVQW